MSLVTNRSHIPIIHVVKPKKAKKPIRKVSKKLSARLKLYAKARAKYLDAHPYCQWWLAENGFLEQDVTFGGRLSGILSSVSLKAPRSIEIHHRKGRVGNLLYDQSYFMAVSREGHNWIHANPRESYESGYMLKR